MRFLCENFVPGSAIWRTHLGRQMPHACVFAPAASTIPPSYSRGQLVIFRSPNHAPRRRRCVLRRFIRSYLDILYRSEMPSSAEEDSHREVSSRGLSQNSIPTSSIFRSFSLYAYASRLFWRAETDIRVLGRNAFHRSCLVLWRGYRMKIPHTQPWIQSCSQQSKRQSTTTSRDSRRWHLQNRRS